MKLLILLMNQCSLRGTICLPLPTLYSLAFMAGQEKMVVVQGTLEMLGLPYNGSGVLASALCMDKYKTTEYLRIRGFDVPPATLVAKSAWQASRRTYVETTYCAA